MAQNLRYKVALLQKPKATTGTLISPLSLPRRLLLVNGLGILAVVINHATGWGMTAMFWWVDSYRSVDALPDLAALDSPAYYVLVLGNVLARFSVPIFVFVSGFFMGYAMQATGASGRTWKVIGSRLAWLLAPYFIWSFVIFAARWLESCETTCQSSSLSSYVQALLLGQAHPAYWYVFVITVLTLFAPLLTHLALVRWRELLAFSGLLLLGARLLPYLSIVPDAPRLPQSIQLFLPVFHNTFYFAFGLVFRFHLGDLKKRTKRFRQGLPLMMFTTVALSLIDIELFSRLDLDRDGLSPDHSHMSLFSEGYSLAMILYFVASERIPVPATGSLIRLGSAVYGIYLLHPLLLEYLARAVHRLTPWFLAYPIAFQLFLVVGAIGLPLLFMSAVKRSPFKRFYRYLFG